jgi:hypothetical protein
VITMVTTERLGPYPTRRLGCSSFVEGVERWLSSALQDDDGRESGARHRRHHYGTAVGGLFREALNLRGQVCAAMRSEAGVTCAVQDRRATASDHPGPDGPAISSANGIRERWHTREAARPRAFDARQPVARRARPR